MFRCNAVQALSTTLLLVACATPLAAEIALPERRVDGKLRVLIVTGGHAFDEAPFFAMFDRMPEILWAHVRYGQDAEKWFSKDLSGRYDALLFYDMNQKHEGHSPALKETIEQGKPAVFLHHALGSYPRWSEYGELIGGRAYFGGDKIPGVPNTKFLHDVWLHVSVADLHHPITAGLRDFDIYDETYKNYLVLPGSHVLLETDHPSSDRAIGWTYTAGKSRVVYLQPGHGPQAFSHPIFETLVRRSLLWTAGLLERKQ